MTAVTAEESLPHVLREYALLADGERGALIGPHGDIGWMCAPRWHDDAVFATLIGGRGVFAITPIGRFVWGGHYEDGSLIWRSRWVTTDGIIECREALAFPGDPNRVVLMRRLLAVRADACAQLVFAPAAGFGRLTMKHLARDDRGCWHARAGDLRVRLDGVAHADVTDHGTALRADLIVPEGGHHDIVVELSAAPPRGPLPDPDTLWASTENAWRTAVPPFANSIAVRDTRHSYAVLRGLTSAGGGMVAAATTSLPERADQGRDYDYRYVWIRDQCYAGQAVAVDGPHPLLDDAVGFVARATARGRTRTSNRPTRSTAAPCPTNAGWSCPATPVAPTSVGNHANGQFQLDAFGEALLLFAAAARHDRLDAQTRRAVAAAVDAIAARWTAPTPASGNSTTAAGRIPG